MSKIWTDSGFRTYKVPNRLFNLLVTCMDLQGDGLLKLTGIFFNRAIQLTIPFENKWHIDFDWHIFRPR